MSKCCSFEFCLMKLPTSLSLSVWEQGLKLMFRYWRLLFLQIAKIISFICFVVNLFQLKSRFFKEGIAAYKNIKSCSNDSFSNLSLAKERIRILISYSNSLPKISLHKPLSVKLISINLNSIKFKLFSIFTKFESSESQSFIDKEFCPRIIILLIYFFYDSVIFSTKHEIWSFSKSLFARNI